ncbi:TonB-dependent receptor plug domain-containing protein [Niabella hirudinis]|uniref:TonB-dependent receptor plug domain-containing protein n=1 Tax=Niabella hirudinis TaxID=1285929 RepID=UPI003EBE4FEC
MKKIFMVAAVLYSSILWSQQGTTLDSITVTATKFPKKMDEVGKAITVIDRDQINKSPGKTVAQLLNEQAGITINGALNNQGSVQTLYMRGANSGRTLLLIDGIPVSDPSMISNEYDLNLISINEVERIEICRGPQSTLYGSDAIAGAINIITVKNNISKPVNARLTGSIGTNTTARGNVQVFGKTKGLTYTTRYAKLYTKGFSSAYDSTGKQNFDKDGYNGDVMNARLQQQLGHFLKASSFVQYSRYQSAIDAGTFMDELDYNIRNKALNTGAGFEFAKGIARITGNYQYGEVYRNYLKDSARSAPGSTNKYLRNQYGARTQFAELYTHLTPTVWLTVLAGGDYRWAKMNQDYLSISSYGPYSSRFDTAALHQESAYASLYFKNRRNTLHLELGGRFNHHSRYGSNTTYTINPSYNINSHIQVYASMATGYKAPSIYQIYDNYSGNSGLEAEKSENYELGTQTRFTTISGRFAFFHRNIKNGIDYNYSTNKYFNFIKQRVTGIETEWNWQPAKNLVIDGNYTYMYGKETLQSRISNADTSYAYFLRRPAHRINIQASYLFCKKLNVSAGAKYVSARYDVGGYQVPDVRLSPYILFQADASYQFNQQFKCFVNAQNLFNKKFFDLYGYNSIPLLVNGGFTLEL